MFGSSTSKGLHYAFEMFPKLYKIQDDSVVQLVTLSNLLETGQFEKYWEEASKMEPLIKTLPAKFTAAIRKCAHLLIL